MGYISNYGKFLKDGNTRNRQQLETYMEQLIGSKFGKEYNRLYIVTLFIKLICRVHHVKGQAGCLTSWNQNCWETYQ